MLTSTKEPLPDVATAASQPQPLSTLGAASGCPAHPGFASGSRPRVLVVQVGARHNYAVPNVLSSGGMLSALCTDACAGTGAARVLDWCPAAVLPAALRRLRARRPRPDVLTRTRSFPWLTLGHLVRRRLARTPEARFREALRFQDRLSLAMAAGDLGDATWIYSILGEAGAFLAHAKRKGLSVVSEVSIALSADDIALAEHAAFPGWGPKPLDQKALEGTNSEPNAALLGLTDVFLCPSDVVRDDLVRTWGVPEEKTVVIPYMVDPKWLDLRPEPQPGRILFAGTADLRKGIHYLAQAADLLQRRGRSYRIRIAGDAAPEVRAQPLCRSFEFLGRVPRDQIEQEFRSADLFVLPTLAEGSATVIYEAMAVGLPVVTTPSAGSVLRHGRDGIIVAERNAEALADAIEMLVEERGLREQMGNSARERSRDFGPEQFAHRLMAALSSLPVAFRGEASS